MNIELNFPGIMETKPYEPEGVVLTQAAQDFIKSQLDNRGKGEGIRLGVNGAGCGGYMYSVEFVDEYTEENEHIFQQKDVKVFIDKKAIILLDGLSVDYVNEGFQSGLTFSNPKANACGCGESFSI